jgi:hypothetical protein
MTLVRAQCSLLPQLDALVAENGPCAGAVVCHQEDNAGPHKEGNFHNRLEAEFKKSKWQLELQAPQGPYTNVLDLHNYFQQCLKGTQLCYNRIAMRRLQRTRRGA